MMGEFCGGGAGGASMAYGETVSALPTGPGGHGVLSMGLSARVALCV